MSDGELLDPPADEKTLNALDRLRAARGLRVHGLLVGRSRLDDPATDAFRNAAPESPMGVLCDDISTFLAAHDDLTLLREASAAPAPAATTKRGGALYAARGRPSTRLYATARDDDGAPTFPVAPEDLERAAAARSRSSGATGNVCAPSSSRAVA